MVKENHKSKPNGYLSDMVFDRLLQSIKSGAYAVDEKLPTENDLASEFQVSRPVVRDALQKLRDQRLIYSRKGAGSFVRHGGMRTPIGFGRVENLADLKRCYQFRLVIEPAAAQIAARNRSADGLGAIFAALSLMQTATEQKRHREDADFAFHHAITLATGNHYFSTAMDSLKDHIAVGMQFHGKSLIRTAHGLDTVFEEHKSIYMAIKDQNPTLAHDLMKRHLLGSHDRLFYGKDHGAETDFSESRLVNL